MVGLVVQLSMAVARPVLVGSSEMPHSTVDVGGAGQDRCDRVIHGDRLGAIGKVAAGVGDPVHAGHLAGHRPTSPLSLIRENVSGELQVSVAVPPAARNAARLV